MYYITITFLAFLYSTSLVAGRYDASQRYTRDLYTRNLGARDAVPEALAEAYAEAIAEANARAFAELQPAHIFARGKQDKVDKVEADRDICLKDWIGKKGTCKTVRYATYDSKGKSGVASKKVCAIAKAGAGDKDLWCSGCSGKKEGATCTVPNADGSSATGGQKKIDAPEYTVEEPPEPAEEKKKQKQIGWH